MSVFRGIVDFDHPNIPGSPDAAANAAKPVRQSMAMLRRGQQIHLEVNEFIFSSVPWILTEYSGI